MRGGIQIDDRTDCLASTNASIKILLKNGEHYWNSSLTYANIENLYATSSWEEIIEILLFFHDRLQRREE